MVWFHRGARWQACGFNSKLCNTIVVNNANGDLVSSFYCRLNAPRPTFTQDMSPAESEVMRQHAIYWREHLAKGKVVAFGLVADPAGAFGVGLVECDDMDEARAFTDGDPTIQSGRGFSFDIFPMPFGIVR